ncbi:MAG: acyltransferase [Xylophilus ampelinus]
MNVANPLLILVCIALALLTIQLPKRAYGSPPLSGRYGSIDGLRGYLGFLVFLSHAYLWPEYVRSGFWGHSSQVLRHFGEASVLLFFMITGFLFTGKLLRGADRPVDWLELFVGRALRLVPLYAAAMVVLAVLVLCTTGLTLNQDPLEIVKRALHWAGFTIFNAPDVNGFKETRLVMSGVTWTLPYEWMFYLALPAMALALHRRVSLMLVGACSTLAGVIFVFNHRPMCLLAFVSGIASAWLVRSDALQRFARSTSATVLTITCLAVTILGFESAYKIVPTILVSVAFALIAAGCSLGGVLTAGTSRMLGDCSYGLYLLHGFVLYITYRFVLGFDVAARLSTTQHWMIVMACTPVLVLIAYASFRFIEAPVMRKTAVVTAMLRRRPMLEAVEAAA